MGEFYHEYFLTYSFELETHFLYNRHTVTSDKFRSHLKRVQAPRVHLISSRFCSLNLQNGDFYDYQECSSLTVFKFTHLFTDKTIEEDKRGRVAKGNHGSG